MTQAKPRISEELAGLSRSAWERLICEANLGLEDAEVARRYFIDKQCQIDIAIEKDTDRTQISRRLKRARGRIEKIYYSGYSGIPS